jgi:hypothetical protein
MLRNILIKDEKIRRLYINTHVRILNINHIFHMVYVLGTAYSERKFL